MAINSDDIAHQYFNSYSTQILHYCNLDRESYTQEIKSI